jgi:hypothetical protein
MTQPDKLPIYDDDYPQLHIKTWKIKDMCEDFGEFWTPSYEVEKRNRQHKAREQALAERLKSLIKVDYDGVDCIWNSQRTAKDIQKLIAELENKNDR